MVQYVLNIKDLTLDMGLRAANLHLHAQSVQVTVHVLEKTLRCTTGQGTCLQ